MTGTHQIGRRFGKLAPIAEQTVRIRPVPRTTTLDSVSFTLNFHTHQLSSPRADLSQLFDGSWMSNIYLPGGAG